MAGEKQIPEEVRAAVAAEIEELCLHSSDRKVASTLGVSNETIRKARGGSLGQKVVEALVRVSGHSLEDIVRRRGGPAAVAGIPRWMRQTDGQPRAALSVVPTLPTDDSSDVRYFNLEVELRRAATEGKPWSDDEQKAARAMVFKLGHDPMPERWREILGYVKRGRLDVEAGREIGVPVKDADVAKPPGLPPKKKR